MQDEQTAVEKPSLLSPDAAPLVGLSPRKKLAPLLSDDGYDGGGSADVEYEFGDDDDDESESEDEDDMVTKKDSMRSVGDNNMTPLSPLAPRRKPTGITAATTTKSLVNGALLMSPSAKRVSSSSSSSRGAR